MKEIVTAPHLCQQGGGKFNLEGEEVRGKRRQEERESDNMTENLRLLVIIGTVIQLDFNTAPQNGSFGDLIKFRNKGQLNATVVKRHNRMSRRVSHTSN